MDLTVFNNQVLFLGRYTQTSYGLWTTDGTAAHTVQLTGITGANSAGIFTQASTPDVPDFTVYAGKVLFNGVDTAGHLGLWTTNGTAAGTTEVTGISGAAATGVDPSDMTVFKGAVLFNGVDTAGTKGCGRRTARRPGPPSCPPVSAGARTTGVDPTDMTVFNGEVLFNGVDSSGEVGLWVTNGTAGGTNEISGSRGGSKRIGPDQHDRLRRRSPVHGQRCERRTRHYG